MASPVLTMQVARKGLLLVLLLVLASLLLWAQPLLLGKLIPQVDHITHLRWSYQFQVAVTEGWLIPRWAFASHQGLGDPTFLYYSPLLYYLSTLFSLAGLSPERALLSAAWVPYVLLAVIAAGLLRRMGNVWLAIAGGLLVITCPALFFLSTHYGALPWVLAAPFVVLFAVQSVKDSPDPMMVAAAFALICLSHILSGLMILLAVGGARLLLWLPARIGFVGQLKWAVGILLGLGLSAFYLYPALTLQGLINPAGWTDEPTLDWRRAFAFPVVSYFQYGFRWFAIQWPLPLLAVAMIISVYLLSKTVDARDDDGYQQMAKRLALVAVVGLLLSSELAYPLYAQIDQLQKIQWPYRFTVPSLLLATVALSLLLGLARNSKFKWLVMGIIFFQTAMVAYLQYSIAVHGKSMPTLEKVLKGEFGQPEYLPATRGEGWKEYLKAGGFVGYCQRQNLACESLISQSHLRKWRIASDKDEVVLLPLFAFPGWACEVDGARVKPSIDSATGLLAVALTLGPHVVSVEWVGMENELHGQLISLASMVLLLATFILRCTPYTNTAGRVTNA